MSIKRLGVWGVRLGVLGLGLCLMALPLQANPIERLLERIDPGASEKFRVEIADGQRDFFEISSEAPTIVIRANSWVNAAVGLNWYLKHYAGIHLSWNGMTATLPEVLPEVPMPERHESDLSLRYCFNYCTFSYTMAFWDWERWEQEIDWMALHGINMPLAAVGLESVWRNMLRRLNYSDEQIGQFIAGPAFLAWWAMNNLEGWGGPLPDSWYEQQTALQQQILARMKEYGMTPVLPGYYGMIPSGEEKSDSHAALKKWNGFTRPATLLPSDPRFDQWAQIFYEEQAKLFGTARYYSMDPFHELGGEDAIARTGDNSIGAMAQAIYSALTTYTQQPGRTTDEQPVWVIQGWTENPRNELLDALQPGQLIVLDLFSECRPQWGAPSIWWREEGYRGHQWLFCLLENFGANSGMHGRIDQLLNNFALAREERDCRGWGYTMEGSETNAVMYEMMSEMPWRSDGETTSYAPQAADWVFARYGLSDERLERAWQLLFSTIYNCPAGNNQQGPTESIFCARPTLNTYQVSSWSKMQNYYALDVSSSAAALVEQVVNDPNTAQRLATNPCAMNNLLYDYVDMRRQANADRARELYNQCVADFKSNNQAMLADHSKQFISLLIEQDSLLSTRKEFCLSTWLDRARAKGTTPEEQQLYEWNARVQITTWGDRYCANTGGLRDYAHKEWSQLLREFYLPRWQAFFNYLLEHPYTQIPPYPLENESGIDYYSLEEQWVGKH